MHPVRNALHFNEKPVLLLSCIVLENEGGQMTTIS